MNAKQPAYIDAQNFGTDEMYFVDSLTLPFNFPLHRHSFIEIEYMISGGACVNVVNGIRYDFVPGSMSLVLPWQVHELIIDEKAPPKLLKCSFRPDFARDFGGILKDLSSIIMQTPDCPPIVTFSQEERSRVEDLFSVMLSERHLRKAFKDELFFSRISELVVFFLRLAMPEQQQNSFSVWNLVRIINSRAAEPGLRCSDIAAYFGYSTSRINTLLRENTGMSFGELLREARVRLASMYLSSSNEKLENVALCAGFGSRSAMYEAFIAVKGVSPSEYRSTHTQTEIQLLDRSERFTKLIYYIHAHYMEPLTLDGLAKEFSYSAAHLSRLFAGSGSNFTEFLNEVRIYNACKLLLVSDMSITDIGMTVGFSSSETFFRNFKRLRGMSPRQYRQNATKE